MNNKLNRYYPSHNNNTYYALYSPPIQRFLLVDNYNIFVFFKTAQILSSKINTVLFVLPSDEKWPQMTNNNCLKFTFHHIKFQNECGGNNIKQSPTVSFLKINRSTKIVKTIFPTDFQDENRKRKILEIQEYAQFVNLCMHSIMLTSIIHQQAHIEQEQNEYRSFLFNEPLQPTLATHFMNILTFANSIKEAQEQIKSFWLTTIQQNISTRVFYTEKVKTEFFNHCNEFYSILGINTPIEIQELANNVTI